MRRPLLPLPLLALGSAAPPAAAPPRLVLPIACTLGQDCAIQSYRDDDSGDGVRDYACHGRTYAGHDGTDFRITSMVAERRGVAVLAPAAGTVLRVRDGVEDRSVRLAPSGAVLGQECGNGLVIDHGGGWETQLCHLAKGSVAVRPGQQVTAGTPVGRVGLSGNTEFPHVHLTVRQDGKAIDPFAYGAPAASCSAGRSLWAQTPAYCAGAVLVAGFAAAPVTMEQVQDTGADQQPRPARATPLVAFAQAIGLEAGDVQRLTLTAPDGRVVADNQAQPLERDKAQTLLYAGRKALPGGWPAGQYRATYSVQRKGTTVISQAWTITLS